jgi:hypothetical protein
MVRLISSETRSAHDLTAVVDQQRTFEEQAIAEYRSEAATAGTSVRPTERAKVNHLPMLP